MASDAAGNVYVVDQYNYRIQKFTSTGTYLTQWGSLGSGDGQFNEPTGVATDAASNVFVVDALNSRVQKFGPASVLMALAVPGTLNLHSLGRWVTAYLQPLTGFDANAIDVSSIQFHGNVTTAGPVPVDATAPSAIGDQNGDQVPDLMVKFDRAAVELALTAGGAMPVTVTGTVAGQAFSGGTTLRVLRARITAPTAGSVLNAGTVTTVRWEMPTEVTIQSVALLSSMDDGESWTLDATGIPNTGSYDWRVPNVQTAQAKVAMVLVESADETSPIVDGVLGVSEAFSIDAPVGVGDRGTAQFALRGVTPNPAQNELRVSFSLRDSKAASLALFDVSGRQLAARRVDGMGPGWHTVPLGGRSNLPAGLYVIRLTQEGQSLATRAAVIR